MRGQVEQHGVALVVEPDRRQVRPPGAAGDRHDRRDRLVEQPPVDRVEIGETGDRVPVTDLELSRLDALGDVPEATVIAIVGSFGV
ncbi:hypothetical protein GCM10010210_26900 [Pseudonocardia hydrocarbonoxydans]|uniref:Uncharacterized protein n=1 Tax=Pseudonocardia hydrocarbonoxydans TaxID=76726 RepID=A0A4Y3WML2_9PSEU|nr:hypothetical protein PHY01_22870 [Pseudonocardia hydrocarbonoxydans]